MTTPLIIVHRLTRCDTSEPGGSEQASEAASGQTRVALVCRERALPGDEVAGQLVDELHRNFNRKAGKAWAEFTEQAPFARKLADYLTDELDFVEFSTRAGHDLVAAINHHGIGQEGFLVFARYQNLATDYLLIGLLDENESMAINERLEVNRASSLAVNSFSLAARIELSELNLFDQDHDLNDQVNSKRAPIAFIKGRAGRKVADFFLEFLGCEEVVDSKEETKALINAVDDYCQEIQLDKQEAGELKQKLVEHCKQQSEIGDSVNLQAISEQLETDAPTSFYDFASSMEQPLHQEMPLETAALKKMVRLSGSGGGLSVGFDAHLLGDRLHYDPVNDVLTIRELPKGLRQQIRQNMGLEQE